MAVSKISRDPHIFELQADMNSKQSYSFKVPRTNAGNFGNGLLYGSTSGTNCGLYIVHLPATTSGTASLIPIKEIVGRTLSASFNGETLTISSTDTMWGGLHLIWINQ